MNTRKIIITIVKRSYGIEKRWKSPSNPGIQKRLDVLEDEAEIDIESMENLDVEHEEPDFMQAHQSYKSYQKELTKNKELLKLRIVGRKYFNQVEPSLLTYIEKEQIRYLHDSDPREYTPEKLSESFPVLPHTIRKILKAKWTPKSVDRVINHDQRVIENWKKFKTGQLPLEPRLREHLQKFKGRIISLPNREELEKKLIPPEKSFAKPRSQLYSEIIRSYLDQGKDEVSNSKETSLSVKENKVIDFKDNFNQTINHNDLMDTNVRWRQDYETSKPRFGNEVATLENKELSMKAKTRDARHSGRAFLTVDEFFKDRVKNMDGELSMEDKVLLDTYKQKIESDIVKDESIVREDKLKIKNFGESNSVTLLTEKDLQSSVEEHKNSASLRVVDDSKETGLETYVKIWEKKASQDDDYPETIKIPKAKYHPEKLYKLRDCYYDSDGEFLYRVPGLKD